MLEYDEKTEERSNSAFGQGFAIGVAEGRIISKFRILRILIEDFTDNQIRGLEPVKGDNTRLHKIWNTSDRIHLLA